MIDLRKEWYDFSHTSARADAGFTFVIKNFDFGKLPMYDEHTEIAELPGAFTICRRNATIGRVLENYNAYWLAMRDQTNFDASQHYEANPMPDGSLQVVEATVRVHDDAHPEWTRISVGFPASFIKPGAHELVLHCDGVRLHILLDGTLMDENFIYGTIDLSRSDELRAGHRIVDYSNADRIGVAKLQTRFSVPAVLPEVTVMREVRDETLQFFSPPGFNAWVGDVVPFEHDGIVHMFYLLDRRHHGSKWITGAHYYGHYSSKDLVHWTEHEPIAPIEHQWETCGTGTPFFHNGKYYFAYGLHTDRFTPYESNAGILLRQEAERTGMTHARSFDELGGRNPQGMTYAVSDDCIHFRKSRKLTHFSENPSVYTMPDNTLRMYADGLWRADGIDGPWTRLRNDFPPSGKDSAMRNSLECPSFFEWNGHFYLVVGMDGFYGADNAEFDNYEDLAAEGRDVYDGMIVPMVIPFQQTRRLISGWIFPFGSYFCMHELVQFADKNLGSKWVPELYPKVRRTDRLADVVENQPEPKVVDSQPNYACYSMEIEGDSGAVSVQFLGRNGKGCEFQLDLGGKWAQYETIDNNAFAPPLKTMREVVAEWKDRVAIFKSIPVEIKYKCHVFSKDYRLDQLRGTDKKFTLRLMMKKDAKMPATIIDAEIAGVRTMVSLRLYHDVDRVAIAVKGGARATAVKADRF